MKILWHGTGSFRDQSIHRRGLLRGPREEWLYASENIEVAGAFAVARADYEGQEPLLIKFNRLGKWQRDIKLPFWNSWRAKIDIPPSEILEFKIIDPEESEDSYILYHKSLKLAHKIGIGGFQN